jgi:hypothetical protein
MTFKKRKKLIPYHFLKENPNPTFAEVFKLGVEGEYNHFLDGLYTLSDLYHYKSKNLQEIEQQASESGFTLYVLHQAIGCYFGGGLAVGLFGNAPQLMAYLPQTTREIGQNKVAEVIEKVKGVFPSFTDFTHNDQLYCDILNMMENPNRKVVSEKVVCLSQKEKEAYHQQYIKALDEAEAVLEPLWAWEENLDESITYKSLQSYYLRHKDETIFKGSNR